MSEASINLKKMTITNLILHNVVKKQHDKVVNKMLRKTEIKIEEKHYSLLHQILKIYYDKSNPAYGVFDSNETSYPYQKLAKDFISTKTTFKDFSIQAVEHFISKIKDEVNATGGYFLMAKFESRDMEFIATIMLNNMTSYGINENDLNVDETLTLDINKVDVANIINLKKWKQKDNTYLSFTKGRKNISDYFVNFIGCSKITDAKHYSKNFKFAFNEFLIHKDFTDDEKAKLKMNAHSYMKECAASKNDFTVDGFVNRVFPDNPKEAKRYISRSKFEVTSSFRCDMQTFKDYQFIFYKSKELNFQFSKSLIDQQIVVYDKDKKHLTITQLDESVVKQIEEGGE